MRERGRSLSAIAVGNATARAICSGRATRGRWYEDSAWFNPFVGGSHEFLARKRRPRSRCRDHVPLRVHGGDGPWWPRSSELGSQYAVAALTPNGNYLDGSKTIR